MAKDGLKGNVLEVSIVCALLVVGAVAFMSGVFNKKVDISRTYEERVVANPRDLGAVYLRGLHRCYQGQYQGAIDDMTAVMVGGPRPDALSVRCKAYYKLKNYPEALKDINEVIHLDPKDEEYYLMRADVYEAMGNKEMANKDVEKSKEFAGPPEWRKGEKPRQR